MCCEMVAKVLNMFKNFMRFFFGKTCRKTVARLSCDSGTTFMRVSQTCRREILANLQCENFATLVRLSCECHQIGARQSSRLSGEKIKLSDICANFVRLSRMSRDCRTNENETKATFVGTS